MESRRWKMRGRGRKEKRVKFKKVSVILGSRERKSQQCELFRGDLPQ